MSRTRSILPTPILSSIVLTGLLAACGADPGPGGATPGPDASVQPDGELPGTLDPAACSGVAANFVAGAQACGSPLPGSAQARLETICRNGVAAADLCGGDPARGLACLETPDATDWTCEAGEPLPACNGDLAASLGIYCVMALGNPACASGIQCDFDADCSDGLSCNGATGQCFATSAYCVGLPCNFDADCPDGETCNGAEGACIRE